VGRRWLYWLYIMFHGTIDSSTLRSKVLGTRAEQGRDRCLVFHLRLYSIDALYRGAFAYFPAGMGISWRLISCPCRTIPHCADAALLNCSVLITSTNTTLLGDLASPPRYHSTLSLLFIWNSVFGMALRCCAWWSGPYLLGVARDFEGVAAQNKREQAGRDPVAHQSHPFQFQLLLYYQQLAKFEPSIVGK